MSWAAKKETNQEKNQKGSYELRYRGRGKRGEEERDERPRMATVWAMDDTPAS